jgi:ribosomal protein S18 acetylase RimI-like enzyme
MNVDILRIGPGDAAVLGQVAEDVFDDDIDPARVTAYLAEPNHLMVLAVAGGEVVGQTRGVVHRHPDLPTELYIDNLGVTPARRREGVATRLLDELVAWGREKGCEEAWVGTEPDNDGARALYQGRGSEAETFVMYFYEFDAT